MNITISSLSVSVNKNILLDDINLTLRPNTLTVLIGPNGAGKSTLIKACSGDLTPTTGSIALNQQNINGYLLRDLARLRAVMSQEYAMSFSFSVSEIVRMGCFAYDGDVSKSQQDKIVEEVMAFMDIQVLAQRQFLTLSGGEQQRTQLARVLAQLWHPHTQQEPRYLFLDEPTSSLDIFYQHQVLRLSQQLTQRNIGVMAIVHDLSLAASYADQLVLLADGKVITQGLPSEVLQEQHLLPVYGVKAHYFKQSDQVQPSVLIKDTTY